MTRDNLKLPIGGYFIGFFRTLKRENQQNDRSVFILLTILSVRVLILILWQFYR
ncbi:hypothetical protein [Bacillus sp. Man26]|uniref:hypothetical protein n=1 Tax=Niallia sp. BSM11 TaxID=3391576 RepID=UPI001EDB1D87